MVLLTFVERSLGMVSMLILARLLAPADFGIIGMASAFIGVAQLLTTFGFDIALIQNQKSPESHYHTAWTFNVLVGLGILVLMIAIANPISKFYREPEVFWVVCALAIGPLVGGCENIGVVAFRKELEFRKEFFFQISRKLIGFAVTVPLALWLRNYWALVAGMLAARIAGTVTSYWVHPFRPRFSLSGAAGIFGFSKWLLLNNAAGFLKERASDFIIGRLSGAAALGIYTISYEFAHLPTTEIGAPINRALLPGFAKIEDPEVVRTTYAKAIQVLAVAAIPAAAGILAIAPWFLPVVLGSKWIDGVPIMEVLSVSGGLLMFQSSACSVLIARGFPAAVTQTNALFVVILLCFLFAFVPIHGVMGAAYATLATTATTMGIYLGQLRTRIGIPALIFFRAIFRPVVASAVMVLVVRGVMPSFSAAMTSMAHVVWLISGIVLGAATYVLVALTLWVVAGRSDGAERWILDSIVDRLGTYFAKRRAAR